MVSMARVDLVVGDSIEGASGVALVAAHYSGMVSMGCVRVSMLTRRVLEMLGSPLLPSLPKFLPEVQMEGSLFDKLSVLIHEHSDHKVLLGGSDAQKGEIAEWTKFSETRSFTINSNEDLATLNTRLAERTFIGSPDNVSLADIAVFIGVRPSMNLAKHRVANELPHLTRWFNQLQNMNGLLPDNGMLDIFHFDGVDPHAHAPANYSDSPAANTKRKEKKSKDKKQNTEAASGAEKPSKPSSVRPVEDVTRLDVRVGKIVKVWRHPDADKLYCEEIDIGETQPRRIASGLVPYMSIEELQDARVLVLANLKAKALKGYESHGMVLCAASPDKTKIEFVIPPPNVPIGEKIYWEGLEGLPDEQLNDKKNPFSKVQPDFRTSDNREALYKEHRFLTSEGPCTCHSITGGSIS